MLHFDLTNKPQTKPYMKARTTDLAFITEPFTLDTQEGVLTISPQTVDDWDGGYFVAYQSDGSKPYAIAPKYVRDNYVEAQGGASKRCEPCRQTGAVHCADPENCGGPWDKRNDGA